MDNSTWVIIALIILIFIVLPITLSLLYTYVVVPNKRSKESFDENDKSSFFDALLNSNSQTQQMFLNMIDPETGTLKVNEIKLGTKTVTEKNLTSKAGTAKHKEYVAPPSGTTDDYNIIVSAAKMGRGEPNSEQDNALLKFTCSAKATSNKQKWQIECSYKYRSQNTGNGTMYFDGVANYLIVPK